MNKTDKESSKDAMSLDNSDPVRPCVLIHDLPIPPSSNNQYMIVKRGRKMLHVPSKELTEYKLKMNNISILDPDFKSFKDTIRGWVERGYVLEIRAQFYFKHNRIFTKDSRVKKMDVSNRIKALHDSLSAILGVDDSFFFQIFAEKICCDPDLEEMVIVEILPLIIVFP